MKQFTNRLTPKQIAQAFHLECESLAPQLLKKRRRQMRQLADRLAMINLSTDSLTAEICCNMWVNLYGVQLEKDIRRLKNIIFTHKQISGKIKNMPNKPSLDVESARLTPIEQLYHFEKVRNGSRRISASCPFHADRHPSFVIYKETNTFHCFSCGKNGDSISFVQFLNGIDFKGAVGVING